MQSIVKGIIQEFGPPAYEDKGRLASLNDVFWAVYYAKNREKLIWEPDEHEFYEYDPSTGIFSPKTTDTIRLECNALMLDAAKNWDGIGALAQFRSASNLAGPLSYLRGYVEEQDFFKAPSHYVHLGNCTLKFEPDGSKFSPEPFSVEHRSRNRSPINYDPEATCPKFEECILGHVQEDDRLLLQKYAGQCLLGRNLTQRFVILDGVGGASKGAFVQVLNGIVGPKNAYELRPKMIGERFEVGRMAKRTLLVGSDVKGDFLNGPGGYRIKSFVGGDLLEGEMKSSNHSITVYGVFNLIITSNARLQICLDGDQSAWERRLIIIRYDKPFSGTKIFEIEKKLLSEEASGILNWCIKGLSLLFQDYADAGDVILTSEQKSRVSDLLSESDSLRLFLTNEIVRDDKKSSNGDRYSLTVDEIVKNYLEDCIHAKQWTPVPAPTAEKQLPELMIRCFGTTKSHDLKREGKSKRGF
jgi:putative DNA primase/helicase